MAIRHLRTFQTRFEPNVPSDTPAHISEAYMDHNMPGFIWNFREAGSRLVGGRLDHMPDGPPAAFTLYRSDTDAILCTYTEIVAFAPAIKPVEEGVVHVFYRYRGYSFCVTRLAQGNFYCILVSHRPIQEFVQVIAGNL